MSEETRIILHGMKILIEREWKSNLALVIEGSKIRAIIDSEMIKNHQPAKLYKLPKEYLLTPGLIDMHIHGARGSDVMDATETALTQICNALAEEGVTGFLATTLTASDNAIESVIKTVTQVMKQSDSGILGIHLEGPFLSANKLGAQNGAHIQKPNTNKIRQWQTLAQGAIKLVTLAPELPGAIEMIKCLVSMGVIAAIGHTDARYKATVAALKAGASYGTHLYNCMRINHQREPGASLALLLDPIATIELIVDNSHLHPAILELALRVKDKKNIILVSDSMRAKGLGDGEYDLGGLHVMVKDGIATLASGALAGSTLKLSTAVKNAEALRFCTLIDAIEMVTANPARILGFIETKGTIEAGKDADLAVFDADFNAVVTMRMGKIVWEGDLPDNN